MDIKLIRTREEYRAALARLDAKMAADPPRGTPESEALQLLALVIGKYEDEHFPIAAPDPIDFIKFRMEQEGLSRKDLEPYFGSKSKVSEVLSRKRPLTLAMIQRLHEGLGIPAQVLIGQSKSRRASKRSSKTLRSLALADLRAGTRVLRSRMVRPKPSARRRAPQ